MTEPYVINHEYDGHKTHTEHCHVTDVTKNDQVYTITIERTSENGGGHFQIHNRRRGDLERAIGSDDPMKLIGEDVTILCANGFEFYSMELED